MAGGFSDYSRSNPLYSQAYESIDRRAAEEAERKRKLSTLEGGQRLRDFGWNQLGQIGGRQAPQAGNTVVGDVRTGQASQLNAGPQDQWRQAQLATAQRLQGIASGQQQGAGELAVQRQGARAIAGQAAMARMARGGGAALAARGAAANTGNIGVNVAGQAQQAALSDQQAANQTLTSLIGQGREQDIGFAGQNANLSQQMNLANLSAQNQQIFQQAGLDQSTSLANMQAKLSTMGMNDQAALGYMAQLYGISAAEMQARLQLELNKKEGSSFWGPLATIGGTIIGGIAGGPAGAAAGGAAGASVGGGK